MRSRGSSNRLSSGSNFGSRVTILLFSMFATMASFYVAGRLWQDAQSRVYLIKELDKTSGQYCTVAKVDDLGFHFQGEASVSVDDTLKIIACREQEQKLDALQIEIGKAREEGFVLKNSVEKSETGTKNKLLAVIGIITKFGHKKNRDAIRRAWMSAGGALNEVEGENGIIIRFVIGRTANQGEDLERDIANENRRAKDFIILNDHVETREELPKKSKLFFIQAVEYWDAEFYVKVNDDMYLNIDALGAVLASNLDNRRAYIGCMKSGEVFSQPTSKWYEPDWWKFGDGKSYLRHASGEIYAISRALAQFISINRLILSSYAHDDVSAGSWFIGIDVKHVDEPKFCCSSWSTGAICAAA